MDNDAKWFAILMITLFVVQMAGMGISEWRHQDCRMELAKAGRSVDEIKELCK